MNTNVKSAGVLNIFKSILIAVFLIATGAVIYSTSVVVYISITKKPCPWAVSFSEVGNVF